MIHVNVQDLGLLGFEVVYLVHVALGLRVCVSRLGAGATARCYDCRDKDECDVADTKCEYNESTCNGLYM